MKQKCDLKAWANHYYRYSEEYAARMGNKWELKWLSQFKPFVDIVQELAGKEGKVLDIGCGGRQSTYLIAPEVHHITGMDYSLQSLLRECPPQPPNARFTNADALDLPFPNNSFDVVSSFATFEHLPDVRKALCESLRVTKTGGWIVIFAPNMISPLRSASLFFAGFKRLKWHPDAYPPYLLYILWLNFIKATGIHQEFIYRSPLVDDLSFLGSDYDAICLINPFDLINFARAQKLKITQIAHGTSDIGKFVAHSLPYFSGGIGFVARKTTQKFCS